MANQHKTALHHAAAELAAEAQKHNIQIDAGERMIVWRDVVKGVRPYTSKVECRRLIQNLIKYAKRVEAKEYKQATQSSLLGDDYV